MNKEIKITPNGIKQAIENLLNENEQLQKENKILRKNAEHNDKVVDKVNWENNLLKAKNKKYEEEIDRLNKIIHGIDDSRKDTGGYPIHYIDYLLDILKEVK